MIICVGPIFLDRVVKIDSFPKKPIKLVAKGLEKRLGGPAAVASFAVNILGESSELVSRFGDDDAAEFLQSELNEYNINFAKSITVKGALSSQSHIFEDKHGERMLAVFNEKKLVDKKILANFNFTSEQTYLVDAHWVEAAHYVAKNTYDRGIKCIVDLDNFSKNKIKCTIIARWNNGDLVQGSSDLECYEVCKKNGWSFKILKDLHAKIMLVDDKDLFIGSPNLTGRGMNLVPVSNKEMGVKLEATPSDTSIINNLVEESILVDDELYNQFKMWKDKLPKLKKLSYPEFPDVIKNKFVEKYNKLWVHNFPWAKANELLALDNLSDNANHDLELLGLNKDNFNSDLIKQNLLNSRVYNWLINQIKKQENEEIYFGNLSSIIHNSLLDDPTPYRKNVKELQANLYSYIKVFLKNEIVIDVPYKKSERLRLKN